MIRSRFWERWALSLKWSTPFETVCDWKPGDSKQSFSHTKWFLGGKINVSENCVDRHEERNPNKPAIIWEGEPGESLTLSFSQLKIQVSKTANALKELGIQKGDRVSIYMPMVPELAIAMLACTRIGAAHTVVFGGF